MRKKWKRHPKDHKQLNLIEVEEKEAYVEIEEAEDLIKITKKSNSMIIEAIEEATDLMLQEEDSEEAIEAIEEIEESIEAAPSPDPLSLSEAVLLLGLVLLSPHGLIAARLIGSGTALALRRLPLAKLAFNAALFAGEAAIASVFLHLVFRPQSTGPGLWAFAGLSVFLATTFGAGVVACVISFFDSDRPLGLLRGVFQVQIFTATASISLAIVGAAAFARSATNLAYLALLVGGVLMMLKKQTSTVVNC